MITKKDVSDLLALAAAYDYRVIGPADVEAWYAMLDHVGMLETDLEDFRDALMSHYGRSRERVAISDLIERVRDVRRARVDAWLDAPGQEPPEGSYDDPQLYIEWRREGMRAAAARPATHTHPGCVRPNGHVCQRPSGRVCVEDGCGEPAGTRWGPCWCPEHDAVRIDRIEAGFAAVAAEFEAQKRP